MIRNIIKKVLETLLGSYVKTHLVFGLKYPRYYFKLRGTINIDGWLGHKEVVFLYESAKGLVNEPSQRIVEIGTWQGKSAVIMGKALFSCTDVRIVCIDPFNAEGDDQSTPLYRQRRDSMQESLKETCVRNLSRNGVYRIITLLEGYSYDFAKSWKEQIDLLFIDGDHSYEAVRRDFDDWTPFLVKGGLLIMDDVNQQEGGHAGPSRVVTESVLNSPDWYDIDSVGTFLHARRR